MNWEEIFAFYKLNHTLDYFVLFYLIFFVLIVVIYLLVFGKVAFYKYSDIDTNKKFLPVSVIICAQNERDNLLNHLPLFFNQDYPEFEVIVVNDNSTDDTEEVLKAFEYKHKNLKTVKVPYTDKFYGSKKFALTLGIKAAQYDTVLLTDADCYPVSEQWITKMMEACTKQIVLGYGKYKQEKTFLNKLIRYETVYTALQYLGLALNGIPYMGVGRNLMYDKSLFFKNKGFSSHYHILSGDDDLFINEVANKYNTTVQFHPLAHTVSLPKSTWKEWWNQKRRHISTGKYYKLKHQLLLASIHLTQLFFILIFLLLICFKHGFYLILGVFLLKICIQMVTFRCAFKKLDEENLLIFTPFFEIFMLFFIPIIYFTNNIIKITKWN